MTPGAGRETPAPSPAKQPGDGGCDSRPAGGNDRPPGGEKGIIAETKPPEKPPAANPFYHAAPRPKNYAAGLVFRPS